MKALLFSALLNLDVDCEAISHQEIDASVKWKKDVCETYFSEYTNVKMRAIRHTLKKVNQSTNKHIEVSQPVAGRMTIRQVLMNENLELSQATTFYAIDAYKAVWIARKNIPRNVTITEPDIIRETKNIGSIIGIEKFPEINPKGSFIGSSLTKGQILYARYLLDKPLIEVGKQVNVIFASEHIRLNMKGVALHNGFLAEDTIKVRLIDTGKIFLGKIKDNETVTVGI